MPSTNDIWGSKKLVIATYLKFAISEILMCAEHLRFMLMSENTLLSSLWWLQNLSAVYRAPPPHPVSRVVYVLFWNRKASLGFTRHS